MKTIEIQLLFKVFEYHDSVLLCGVFEYALEFCINSPFLGFI